MASRLLRPAAVRARPLAPRLLLALPLLAVGAVACGEAVPLDGRPSAVHPVGFAEDHAAALRAQGYDPAPCYACHDEAAGPGACRDCHADGADACDVCHREPDPAHRPHAAFDCATCHPVPAERASPGHLDDRPEDVRFAGLATARGHAPRWDGARCADTACHAGPDAAAPSPTWGGVTPGGCGACHGMPPTDHPADRCDRCHAPVADADGALVEPALHLDGRVQAADWRALPCDGCHGDADSPAPPRALDGAADVSHPGVGAHRAHLAPADSAPVTCETCHVVPATNDAPGHLDDGMPGAEVALPPPGRYAGGQCADTACHGPDRPNWTGDAPCGTCHGLPPPAHPPGDCARCHLVAAPGGGIADPLRHVDGALDVTALGPDDCATCHAADGRVPPGGSHAAHARHACATCHPAVPPSVAAHLDGATRVTRPGWQAGTCADDACHGVGTPVWGAPDQVIGCDACHGMPPPAHPIGACDDCHPSSDAPSHVDGRVDVTLPEGCDDCHGMELASGSHPAHAAPRWAEPVPCGACHPVPATVDAPGHLDGPPAEVRMAEGAYADGRCADTACHGGAAASRPAPAWGGEAIRCGDCHGIPPPRHLEGPCGECHPAVSDGYDVTRPARHVDGRRDFR